MENNNTTSRALDTVPQFKVDRWLLGTYFVLLFISLVEPYSASSQQVDFGNVYSPFFRHAGQLALGALVMWGFASIRYTYYRLIIPFIALVTIFMFIWMQFKGVTINNATRAIALPGFTLQPSEFAKFSTVGCAALIVSRSQIRGDISLKGLILSTFVVIIGAAMRFSQGATNAVILMASGVSVILIGGVKFRKFITVSLIYLLIFCIFYGIKHHNDDKMEGYQQELIEAKGGIVEVKTDDERYSADNLQKFQKDNSPKDHSRDKMRGGRVSAWIHNEIKDSLIHDPITTENRQEMFAHYAQAHGGWCGVGIGQSRECSRLPLAFTDYIYSIIVEETGVIGAIVVLMIYMWLLIRAGRVASRCSRAFAALLITGMAVMIVYQALIHMAINTGFMPVSGQPLPLISVGGTSILVTSMAFGIMLSVSRSAAKTKQELQQENAELPTEYGAVNPSQIN